MIPIYSGFHFILGFHFNNVPILFKIPFHSEFYFIQLKPGIKCPPSPTEMEPRIKWNREKMKPRIKWNLERNGTQNNLESGNHRPAASH
jgi:hypothetical protein